jgi:hypothetical protein
MMIPMRTASFAGLLVGLGVVAACGGEPADVSGEYSLAVTNRDNGCEFDDWQEGDTAQNIPLTVDQDGRDVTARLGGLAGLFVEAVLGSRTFEGVVSGDRVTLELYGSRSLSEGNCTFTINATVTGTLIGNALSGFIDYTPAHNGNPDCSSIDRCVTTQEFSGSRPPR